MRSYRLLFLLVALVLCFQSVAAAPQAALRRQEDKPTQQSSVPSFTRGASIRPSPTADLSDDESPISSAESSRAPSTSASAPKPTDESIAPQPAQPTTSAAPDVDPENQLPLQPTLTPAMGVTGVILLISGLAFAIIGIKNKW